MLLQGGASLQVLTPERLNRLLTLLVYASRHAGVLPSVSTLLRVNMAVQTVVRQTEAALRLGRGVAGRAQRREQAVVRVQTQFNSVSHDIAEQALRTAQDVAADMASALSPVRPCAPAVTFVTLPHVRPDCWQTVLHVPYRHAAHSSYGLKAELCTDIERLSGLYM